MTVSRREALRRLSVLLGGALSASSLDAVLSGLRADPVQAAWTPRALSPDQADLLAVLVERVIPATDTPGAREAGVHAFIDRLLDEWVEPEERRRFLDGLDGVDGMMREAEGVGFREARRERQLALLDRLDREAVRARREEADPLPFFATLKEWTLVGYYTSETGATEELRWMAVPGRWDADVPVEEVGRTWA